MNSRLDSVIGDFDIVVRFIFIVKTLENLNGFLLRRLADNYRLESPFKSRVFLNVFAVFFKRCCADNLHFAPRKRRLEDICRVNRALCRACAHKGVNFINKEDNIPRFCYLVNSRLDSFLKVAPVFCTCDHACQIKRNNPFVFEQLGYFAVCDFKREPLCNGCFADAGFTDKAGVVFSAPAKNLDNPVNLFLTADNGVDFALLCKLSQISAELLDCGCV